MQGVQPAAKNPSSTDDPVRLAWWPLTTADACRDRAAEYEQRPGCQAKQDDNHTADLAENWPEIVEHPPNTVAARPDDDKDGREAQHERDGMGEVCQRAGSGYWLT